MSLNEFLNDKKYTAVFFLLALCFFLLDWYLFAAVGEKEEHIRRLETETALLENRAKLPKRYCGRYGFLRLYGKRLRCGRNKGRRK